MTQIDVVLPALNEEITIAGTIEAFSRQLPAARIIVVDNGSTDATSVRASAALNEHPGPSLLIVEPRRGKGNAIRTAFAATTGDVVIMVDADLTYPAESVHELVAPVASGEADMVIGDRLSNGSYANENQRSFHGGGNALMLRAVNMLFKSDLHDILTGYRAFSRVYIDSYPVLVRGFDLETDMTVHALDKRLVVREVPVDYRDRPEGSSSKLGTFTDGFKVVLRLLNLWRKFKPLAMFGWLAALLLLSGLVCGAVPVSEFLRSRYINHLPLAVLAASLVLASFTMATISLVLDAIADQGRRSAELHIKQLRAAQATKR